MRKISQTCKATYAHLMNNNLCYLKEKHKIELNRSEFELRGGKVLDLVQPLCTRLNQGAFKY